MTTLDLDPQFVQGLHLIYSKKRDSLEQLLNMLDEYIRQKYGPAKMLCNTLPKKYLPEEQLSDHSSTSSKKSKSSSSKKSSKNNSPITIREMSPDPLQGVDNLEEILQDVACVICSDMNVGARNRLVECVKCRSLYHQECHTPHILDSQVDIRPGVWQCSNCTKSQLPPREKERSSPKTVFESKSKEYKKSSSSSSSSKHTDISADRRLKDMIKKAKQDKKGRSSTSSSSKHSSSSSSSKSSHDKSHRNKSD